MVLNSHRSRCCAQSLFRQIITWFLFFCFFQMKTERWKKGIAPGNGESTSQVSNPLPWQPVSIGKVLWTLVRFYGHFPAVLYHYPNNSNAPSAFFCSISFYFLLQCYHILARSDQSISSHCSDLSGASADYTGPSVKTRISLLSIHPSWWTTNHYKITLREEAFKMAKNEI